jgi:hypothetical protein
VKARQHLPEDDAEGPDVGSRVDGPQPPLLGRHIGRGASDLILPRKLEITDFGRRREARACPSALESASNATVEDFTVPESVKKMLPGLRLLLSRLASAERK